MVWQEGELQRWPRRMQLITRQVCAGPDIAAAYLTVGLAAPVLARVTSCDHLKAIQARVWLSRNL